MKSVIQLLSKPVDNSPLIAFRIIFGLLLTLEAWGAIATGWVKKAFITPEYTFPFIDFSWLQPLPGSGMYIYYILMGCAGVMVTLGWRYRLGVAAYAVMWAGVYFMQKTHYNNHYYLLLLTLALMWLAPAHRYASLDAKRRPELQRLTCPQWAVWMFVAQVSIVYVYAAIAKMYPGWINLSVIKMLFEPKAEYFLVGPLLQKEWFQYIVAFGGIAFDLLIAPALLWRKTRKAAFVISVFFHLFNSAVFQIGIFPYLALAWTLFFFPPDTARRLFFKNRPAQVGAYGAASVGTKDRLIIYSLCVYMFVQAVLPLRHHLYAGSVYWTEEGHRLSWRMMLRLKHGHVKFKIVDPKSGQTWTVKPEEYATPKQANAIACKPDMCWQFVQILKKDFERRGYPEIEVYASGKVSLNGGPYRTLYDPKVDLAGIAWTPFKHAEWLILYD